MSGAPVPATSSFLAPELARPQTHALAEALPRWPWAGKAHKQQHAQRASGDEEDGCEGTTEPQAEGGVPANVGRPQPLPV